MSKPRIGITRKAGTLSQIQESAHWRYRERVKEAGGDGIDFLPRAGSPPELIQAERIHGLLLTGGGDLNPALYGEQNRVSHNIDDERDTFEIGVVRAALERKLPVFGICRGFQILNVANGGLLLQDITTPPYRQHAAGGGISAEHEIELANGSRLRAMLGGLSATVNSRHHQAVTRKTVACPLVATAFSAGEDIVEAIEKPGDAWVVGVQWHPERIDDNIGNSFQVLFEEFIKAAVSAAEPK